MESLSSYFFTNRPPEAKDAAGVDYGAPELERRVKKVQERVSEISYLTANEPSVALYRIQEHVRKTTSALLTERHKMQQFSSTIQDRLSEANETLQVLSDMQRAAHAFHNTRLHIAAAIEFQNALEHMRTQRERQKSVTSSSSPAPKAAASEGAVARPTSTDAESGSNSESSSAPTTETGSTQQSQSTNVTNTTSLH